MQLETTLHPVSRHGSSGERRRTWLRWSASAALAGRGQTEASTDAVACTEVRLFRIPRALIGQLAQDRYELPRGLMQRSQRALGVLTLLQRRSAALDRGALRKALQSEGAA